MHQLRITFTHWKDVVGEKFDQSNSGVRVPIPDGFGALYLFILLLGEATIDLVIEETNRMARQKLAEKPERLVQWHDISRPEFMAYLGLSIIMGINKLPRFSDYWTSDPFLENRGVKSVITKNRFEQICQYLYFSDSSLEPKKGTPGYDRLFKCRQIITNVVSNIQSAYYLFKTSRSMKE